MKRSLNSEDISEEINSNEIDIQLCGNIIMDSNEKSCCGRTVYDINDMICCTGVALFPKTEEHTCCGKVLYICIYHISNLLNVINSVCIKYIQQITFIL